MNAYKRPNPDVARILCLDLGDEWTGAALSDPVGFTAKPFATVPTGQLEDFIVKAMQQENVMEVVIGYPITLRGTESLQTKKVVNKKEELEKAFPTVTFHLWDERLTSQKAQMLKKAKTKEEKLQSHSIAAAFILQSYLDYLYQKKLSGT
ncbi:MAG: Holliday junction resolvase RuvX [Candidatus Babeliales bacterium]